jgi:hypothetical protein
MMLESRQSFYFVHCFKAFVDIYASFQTHTHRRIWYICYLQLGYHPVAVVQYTFAHKQYIEQHNETEYPERNVHNIKNT